MRVALSISILNCFFVSQSCGWSAPAHQRIASLAHDLLKDEKRAQLQSFLVRGKRLSDWMVEESAWADGPEALDDGSNHFADFSSCLDPVIELQCGVSESGDELCIVGALVRHIKRAMISPGGESFRESLRYIIHYMGDIHQPLHVAQSRDVGGNTIKGLRPFTTAAGHDVSLHELWDNHLYQIAKNRSMFGAGFPKYSETSLDFTLKDLESDDSIRTLVEQIALQTATQVTCEYAYWADRTNKESVMPSKTYLGEEYIKNGKEWTVVQVARAGIRLASLLSSILEYRASHGAAAAAAHLRA